MREKYYVRSEDGLVLGLWFSRELGELGIAGPWKFRAEAVEILAEYFGGEPVDTDSVEWKAVRVRLVVERPEWAWLRGLARLRRDYAVKETSSFRRLCR